MARADLSTRPLGRRAPSDWRHVEKYPLRGLADLTGLVPLNVPVIIGVNWYTDYDEPTQGDDGRWRVKLTSSGTVRGGHCVCLQPANLSDTWLWWLFYNQGQEGSCVGFGCSRCMSLLNRKRYAARWVYTTAQNIDEYPDTPPAEGTSVRAGCEVLKQWGLPRARLGVRTLAPDLQAGISAYRWITDTNDLVQVLGYPGGTEVPLLNSWGRDYPHRVWVPVEDIDRLRREDGELAVVTDR